MCITPSIDKTLELIEFVPWLSRSSLPKCCVQKPGVGGRFFVARLKIKLCSFQFSQKIFA